MKDVNVLESLRSQSAWQLLGLGLITYGVCFAYYIQRQSKQMNSALESNDRIPMGFVQAILVPFNDI